MGLQNFGTIPEQSDTEFVQRVKILNALQGVINAQAASGGGGDATAANQAIQITAEQAIQTSVAILDDWDESDRAKVNPVVGQAGVQAGAGAVSANTQRVVIATDQTAVPVTGPLTDAELRASAVPVSAASLPLPTGAATLAEQQTQTTALSAIQTSVQILDDWDESDRAKVNPIVGQAGVQGGAGSVSANTTRVAIATDANAVTAVGTVADDGTTPGAPVMIGGTAKNTDGTDPGSVSAEDDVARVITDRQRILLVNTTNPFLWSATENHATAQTNNELKAAPGANLSLYVTDIVISNGATAGSVRIVSDTGGTPVIQVNEIYLGINGGASLNFKTPIRIPTNTNLGFTSTTVTTHTLYVAGYTAP